MLRRLGRGECGSCVGASIIAKIMRYKELSTPEYQVAENDENRLMYITLPIGKNNELMGSDILEIMGQVTENDNRNTISISAESREEANKIFNGLSEGGKVEMPISDGSFGHYFGMFADKFGVQWMVVFEKNNK